MPNIVPAARYYPKLSEVITVDDLPEFLSFVQDGLDAIFSKIHYKNLQYSKSSKGDSAFYSLEIVSKKISFQLPFDMALTINADEDNNISSFPITLEYQWEILAYLKSFDLSNFSFSLEDFYDLGLKVFRINEDQVLAHIINYFVVPADNDTTKFVQFVEDFNSYLSIRYPSESYVLVLPTNPSVSSLVAAVNALSIPDATISLQLFAIYILDTDLSVTKNKLQQFFNIIVPEGIEAYIKKLIIPRAKATLGLNATIEFPATILRPTDENGTLITLPIGVKSKFKFAKAQLFVDTQKGIGYQLELGGSLDPLNAEIGKTGVLIKIDSLKLDLSKTENISEADADGRPADFIGVYARAISVTLPARWFHDDAVQGTPSTGLRIGGYDLLIGTGGISGLIILEAVPAVIAGGTPYYFDDKFEFDYPITLFQKNATTQAVENVVVNNITELKQKLFPNGSVSIPAYSFKFPLNVKELPLTSGIVRTFQNITDYQAYLNSFPNDNEVDKIPTLWKRIGGADGFRVGFRKFDITFKQNKVVSSDIKGALEIEKFEYPANAHYPNGGQIQQGTKVKIDIEGHLSDNGDFNLTASANPSFPIVLPDVFTYNVKSLELGKEGDDFYIGTAGTLQFDGFLKDVMGLGPIEIDKLRINSDGTIEFIGGGSINLPDPLTLKLGPVDITVTAIHFGSHQREIDGVMRKFNYFGFDGGIKVDPLGIEIRGDGVKFYYCSDDLPNKPHPYLHIQTLYLDLVIPANKPTATINGWLSIPEPGVSKEYSGGIKLQIPSAKIAGSANMKLMPKYPAFLIDLAVEPPAPIPLGPFGIYEFSGLLGYRYVADKEAVGLTAENTWYEYYKAPQLGINVKKFSGPEQTKLTTKPFSIGAGASMGTSGDNGTIFNVKAMVLLSIPTLFMIDGRAAILSARTGIQESKDPPFFAVITIGDDSIELNFGADYNIPNKPKERKGKILHAYAEVQAGFFFKNQKPWYINIGTKADPIQSRILSLLDIKSYIMLSASGIEAGARGEFNFDRNYGVIKVKAHAFIEVGGKISFERPQIGAYIQAEVSASIKVLWVHIGLDVGILFGVEIPRPHLLYGKFYFRIRIRVWHITIFRFRGHLEVVWNINKNVDTTPINPLINQANVSAIPELVKGVNMLSNETFLLAHLDGEPVNETTFMPKVLDYIIPIDTYIDIKTEKGLLPGNVLDPTNSVRRLIGGINNPAKKYVDLIPPVSTIKGRPIRQVRHKYIIEDIAIKFWNGSHWMDYHPYKALYPNDPTVDNLKIGQFQKVDGEYNTVRLLATTPFSYTEQGQLGWYTPEQYGINPTSLFCEGQAIDPKCTNFLLRPLHAHYYCWNPNTPLISNNVSFELLTSNENDFAYITDEANVFNFAKSLAFDNWNSMQVILPQPSVQIGLKLTNFTGGVRVKYYAILSNAANNQLFNVVYGNPDPNAVNVDEPFEVVVSAAALNARVEYNHTDWNPVVKVVVEPIFDTAISQQIALLNEEIATIENDNSLISLGLLEGDIESTGLLVEELHQLVCGGGSDGSNSFVNRYTKPDQLNYYYSKEFFENDLSFIYSIGTTEGNGLISKINPDGSVVWERKYIFPADKTPLIFKKIIKINRDSLIPEERIFRYIVYGSTGDNHYLFGIDYESGGVIWMKRIGVTYKDAIVTITPSVKDFNFYLTVSQINQINTDENAYVALLDANGTFVNGNIYNATDGHQFIIDGTCEISDGLVVAGRYLDGENLMEVGTIMRLDNDLNIIRTLKITEESFAIIHDIKVLENNNYLISGYNHNYDGLFVATVTDEGTYSSYEFPGTQNRTSSIQLSDDGFYLLHTDGLNGVLNKLDFNFNVLWTKEIHLNSGTNGVKNFTYNNVSKKITLNSYNLTEGSLVVYTDKNLSSCLTTSLIQPNLELSQFDIKKLGVSRVQREIVFPDFAITSESVSSNIIKHCLPNDCGEEDEIVCGLYNSILSVYVSNLTDPTSTDIINFVPYVNSYSIILGLISHFNSNYNLDEHLHGETNLIHIFLDIRDIESYTLAWNAVQTILDYLNEIGNCVCDCHSKDFTMIHEVCWMSIEDYEYNINIPSQAAITEDAHATINGITQYIQPIWRPNTSYYIHFMLKDVVGYESVNNGSPFPYTYGFTTSGPVGYFHTNEKSTYGDIALKNGDRLLKEDTTYYIVSSLGLENADSSLFVANTNGFIYEDTTGLLRDASTGAYIFDPTSASNKLRVVAHPDKYPLTSLRQYIDYNRSYPNADGNLLSAKPLFYNDGDATQINLYFIKAYASNFFKTWEPYNGAIAVAGRLKIVIKDPVEGTETVNPPYLDYDPLDTVFVHIPQTTHVWDVDQAPPNQFPVTQYQNMFNADNCIGEVEIIVPASEQIIVYPKHLKASKLYTAIVNNLFDINHNSLLENIAQESAEVHKFVFQTSRYANFNEQINSFYLEQTVEGALAQKESIFRFEKAFTQEEIQASFDVIKNQPIIGFSDGILKTLNNDYQHPYDRIFEGILGLNPLDKPISTEVNIIRDLTTNVVIALIVRNPEPFNNPKFPVNVLADTIEVLNGSTVNPNYSILFSKDNSQAIIMNENKNIDETSLNLKFKYKNYKNIFPGNDPVLNYPVVSEVVLDVDLLNN